MKPPTYAELLDAFIDAYSTLEAVRQKNKLMLEFLNGIKEVQDKAALWDAQREKLLAEAVALVRKMHTAEADAWLENNGYTNTKTSE